MRRRTLAPCLAILTVAATPCGAQQPAPADATIETPSAKPTPAPSRAAPAFDAKGISDLLQRDTGPTVAPRAGAPTALGRPAEDLSARLQLTPDAVNATKFSRVDPAMRGVDPVVLKAEILLDRAHAPPGVIDGRYGSNFVKAIKTYETMRELPVDGKLTKRVWDELGGDTAEPVLVPYTITAQDVVGPFYPDLSPDYAEQAKMPDLGYRSANEMFGERFHMDRKFLAALNPGVDMETAGNTIVVAQVATTRLSTKVARIDVDKGKGQVLAYDADGNLITAYPATIGSDELPSPSGSYVVRGVAPHPTYTYDPKKNFQQGANVNKLILPPGPNNPVGAAFIALSKPTYGIHGTPDPSKIDKTHSHGCVRLTNWNAQELASLVQAGVPVNFIEKPGTVVVSGDATLGGAASSPPEPVDGIAALLGADPSGVR
ncbi:Lipoprotein-anchoring transpeptidase ErfK/SrfK [Beijerinckiaceae bacterium RH AL1]|nr:L,D-transpeptidase [Beijerinckiaceae bacterium]VVB46343.1 Lipoprotein-anchoring transpeptidase ErfK/SrfK [Beijerinckiaceae bacterium RH CH11]VVB46428.1 Lipoprotein-anchoring transpeptidase ErfK/SrfK [Beijerinckiaceae bacterium RH AL8]VVC55327.1 Lipoprotein-anchoring transpeptidase ErfK/SrfK [Beijerinckiaceae bacterium RH AL1]